MARADSTIWATSIRGGLLHLRMSIGMTIRDYNKISETLAQMHALWSEWCKKSCLSYVHTHIAQI